jgi:hypothetical protein
MIFNEKDEKLSFSNYIYSLTNSLKNKNSSKYLVVDHISKCEYDSRIFNNRFVTENFNRFNSSLASNNTSGKLKKIINQKINSKIKGFKNVKIIKYNKEKKIQLVMIFGGDFNSEFSDGFVENLKKLGNTGVKTKTEFFFN